MLMATVASSMVASSSPSSQPFCSFSNPNSSSSSLSFKTKAITRTRPRTKTRTRTTRLTWLNPHPRGALVEATPPPTSSPPSPKDGSIKVLALPENRADDIQAEARALARAANATAYTPQLVASKYGSQPIKVFHFFFLCFSQSLSLFGDIFRGCDWFL